MSEPTTPYGEKKSYPPANKTPADGTYTFYVFPLSDRFPCTGTSAKGNVWVKVELSSSCGARVKTKFFVTDKAVKRTIDFIKACSGVQVTPAEIATEEALKSCVSELCCKKRVTADIKRGEDSTFNGQSYPSYDVSGFKVAVGF